MVRCAVYSILFLCLTACSAGISKKPVSLDSFFDDNSSKVWLIEKVELNNQNFASQKVGLKDVMIFHKSGKVQIQALNSLGEKPGKVGYYFIDSEAKTMRIEFGLLKEYWDFKITELSLEKVILTPQNKSDLNYQLTLIPLPEFNF